MAHAGHQHVVSEQASSSGSEEIAAGASTIVWSNGAMSTGAVIPHGNDDQHLNRVIANSAGTRTQVLKSAADHNARSFASGNSKAVGRPADNVGEVNRTVDISAPTGRPPENSADVTIPTENGEVVNRQNVAPVSRTAENSVEIYRLSENGAPVSRPENDEEIYRLFENVAPVSRPADNSAGRPTSYGREWEQQSAGIPQHLADRLQRRPANSSGHIVHSNDIVDHEGYIDLAEVRHANQLLLLGVLLRRVP